MKKKIIGLLSLAAIAIVVMNVKADRNYSEYEYKSEDSGRKYGGRYYKKEVKEHRDGRDREIYRRENYRGKGPVRATGTAVGETVEGAASVPGRIFGRDRNRQETYKSRTTTTRYVE